MTSSSPVSTRRDTAGAVMTHLAPRVEDPYTKLDVRRNVWNPQDSRPSHRSEDTGAVWAKVPVSSRKNLDTGIRVLFLWTRRTRRSSSSPARGRTPVTSTVVIRPPRERYHVPGVSDVDTRLHR